jgi:hypothetical protein
MAKRRKRSRPRSAPVSEQSSGVSVVEPATSGDAAASSTLTTASFNLPLRTERWLAAVLLGLCALNMLAAAARNSAVCDELGAHIPAGHLYWASGHYSGGIDNFPVGQLWIAAPVRLLGLHYELFTEQHLLLFRLPVIALGLLLMVLIWRFARRLEGPVAGLAALGLASLSPNLLAHSTLATLDLPTAFVIFLSVVLLHRHAAAPSAGWIAAAAIALGIALAVKIQTILLLPLAALALAVATVWARRNSRSTTPALLATWLLIPVVAVVVIDLAYLHIPGVDGGLLPVAYLEAFRTKAVHGSGGHFAYLLGEYSSTGWWYYFPVAILVKTPLPALLLAGVGLARRHRTEVLVFVLAPIVVFLGAGIASRVNIGLRHVLAIYPFLYVLAGFGVARLIGAGRFWRTVVVALAAAHAAAALWIQPHHLSYFNVLAGGAPNGHRILLDSNYDWGQNDRFLARHVTRKGLDYRVDPDPFLASSGPILVNANALYGVLNGGPAAYPWLRDLEPVARIAYTWFEYDVTAGVGEGLARSTAAIDQLGSYLADLRQRDPAMRDPRVRLPLAKALAAVTLYGPAFEEVRAILASDPADEQAFRFGAELIVRHKLGVLRYRDREYLEGFRSLPAPAPLTPAELVACAGDSGTTKELSTLHTAVGFVRATGRDLAGALAAFQFAVALDPGNNVARENLAQLEAVVGRR